MERIKLIELPEVLSTCIETNNLLCFKVYLMKEYMGSLPLYILYLPLGIGHHLCH